MQKHAHFGLPAFGTPHGLTAEMGISPTRKPKTKGISKNKGHHKHQDYLRREQRRHERKRLKGLKKSRFIKFQPKEDFVILPYKTYGYLGVDS